MPRLREFKHLKRRLARRIGREASIFYGLSTFFIAQPNAVQIAFAARRFVRMLWRIFPDTVSSLIKRL